MNEKEMETILNHFFREGARGGRPKERIKPFLEKIGEAWEKYPDLRFVQFINLLYNEAEFDPFHYEEEDTLKLLEKLNQNLSKPKEEN